MGFSMPFANLFTKKRTWDLVLLLSLVSLIYTWGHFRSAFSVLTIPVQVDRSAVATLANSTADQFQLGPQSYKQSVTFRFERSVRDFCELNESLSFQEFLKTNLYHPYRWEIRHFNEFDPNQVRFFFTADGVLNGFLETIDASQPGESLTSSEALRRAKKLAHSKWNINFSDYSLVHIRDKRTPSGRLDYQFTFSLKDQPFVSKPIQLLITMSGDRLTQVQHSFQLPKSFLSNYEALIHDNKQLTTIGRLTFWLLYLIGGCLVGVSVLVKRRHLLWRKPIILGLVISSLMVLTKINELPLLWRTYETVISYRLFLLDFMVKLVAQFVFWSVILSITIMAAESLTRVAFTKRIQLWKLFKPEVSSTLAVLGRVSGGYLLGLIYVGYVIFFHHKISPFFSWWTPPEMLVNPNILGSYFPWFNPLVKSLQSSLWEECLFRAVPLSIAAILGNQFGKRRSFIFIALIIQAFIFSLSHVFYISIPSYVRIFEFMVPAIVFGLVYLSFGLVPVVIAHFTYNVILYSIPLFTTIDQSASVNQFMIIIISLVPLLYIGICRLIHGRLYHVAEDAFNHAWEPTSRIFHKTIKPIEDFTQYKPFKFVLLSICAIVGFCLWVFYTPFSAHSPTVTVSRSDAVTIAKNVLITRGINWNPEWRVLSTFRQGPSSIDQFIWDNGGYDTYKQLLGTYLSPPYWWIRVVEETNGRYIDRYQLSLGPAGQLLRLRDKTQPFATDFRGVDSLSLAKTTLVDLHYTSPDNFVLLNQRSYRHEGVDAERFVFKDLRYQLIVGQARTIVKLAGNHVLDAFQLIVMPRDWVRMNSIKQRLKNRIVTVSTLIKYAFIFAGFIFSLYSWSHHYFHKPSFYFFLCVFFGLELILLINTFPHVLASLSTQTPYMTQIGAWAVKQLTIITAQSTVLSVTLGFIHHGPFRKLNYCVSNRILIAGGLSFMVAGLLSLYYGLVPDQLVWANYGALKFYSPFLSAIVEPLHHYLVITTVLFLILFLIDRLNRLFHWHWLVRPIIILILGFVFSLSQGFYTIYSGLILAVINAITLLLVTKFFLRRHLPFIPLVSAIVSMIHTLKIGCQDPFSGSFNIYVLSALIIFMVGIVWYFYLIISNRKKIV